MRKTVTTAALATGLGLVALGGGQVAEAMIDDGGLEFFGWDVGTGTDADDRGDHTRPEREGRHRDG